MKGSLTWWRKEALEHYWEQRIEIFRKKKKNNATNDQCTSKGNALHWRNQCCLPVGMLTHAISLTLCRSCVGHGSPCEFINATAMSRPKDSLSITIKSHSTSFPICLLKKKTINNYQPSIYHLYSCAQACRGSEQRYQQEAPLRPTHEALS